MICFELEESSEHDPLNRRCKMIRNKVPIFAMLLMLTLMFVPVALMASPGPGQPAPNFTIPDTAGANHSLTDYQGKVVQLFCWQST
ncbi:MAG: redoxin domain-containing protein [Candidatus Parcubacteria bacterium]|nr:redoxin domain-containing protein [Candidatus Parcubacteria bacterium]